MIIVSIRFFPRRTFNVLQFNIRMTDEPFTGEPLVYFSIQMVAFQWSAHGELRNWLTTQNAKEMLGRVIVR